MRQLLKSQNPNKSQSLKSQNSNKNQSPELHLKKKRPGFLRGVKPAILSPALLLDTI